MEQGASGLGIEKQIVRPGHHEPGAEQQQQGQGQGQQPIQLPTPLRLPLPLRAGGEAGEGFEPQGEEGPGGEQIQTGAMAGAFLHRQHEPMAHPQKQPDHQHVHRQPGDHQKASPPQRPWTQEQQQQQGEMERTEANGQGIAHQFPPVGHHQRPLPRAARGSATNFKPIPPHRSDPPGVHAEHGGRQRAPLTPQHQGRQILRAAFRLHFHRAVREVAHPAAEAKILGALAAPFPIAHPLHLSAHDQAPALRDGGRAGVVGGEEAALRGGLPTSAMAAARRKGIVGKPAQ